MQEQEQNLDRRSLEFAEQLRRAQDDGSRPELRGQLAEVVEQHFQLRHERREREIQRLEQQLERLRDSMRKRSERRAEIIQQRVNQLSGEDDLSF